MALGVSGAQPANWHACVAASVAPTPNSGVKTIALWRYYKGALTR